MDPTGYAVGEQNQRQMRRLETVAANLANASTPGYKRAIPAFSAVLEEAASVGEQDGTTGDAEGFGFMVDRSQGPLRQTGRRLDLAIYGKGFFVVATPRGERYTRKGRLYADPYGEVTDASGNPFLGKDGPLNLPADAGDVVVSEGGQLTADGRSVGQLLLVEPDESARLIPEGDGLYRIEGARPGPAVGSSVVQGSIEDSNVKPMRELVQMIELMRSYESSSKVLKRIGRLNGELIQTTA